MRCKGCNDNEGFIWADGSEDELCEHCLEEAGIFELRSDDNNNG